MYAPSAPVPAEIVRFVTLFVTVTATPGNTAPLSSKVVPLSEPDFSCARSGLSASKTNTGKQSTYCAVNLLFLHLSASMPSCLLPQNLNLKVVSLYTLRTKDVKTKSSNSESIGRTRV